MATPATADVPLPSRVRPVELARLPLVWGSLLLFYLYTGLEVTAGLWY